MKTFIVLALLCLGFFLFKDDIFAYSQRMGRERAVREAQEREWERTYQARLQETEQSRYKRVSKPSHQGLPPVPRINLYRSPSTLRDEAQVLINKFKHELRATEDPARLAVISRHFFEGVKDQARGLQSALGSKNVKIILDIYSEAIEIITGLEEEELKARRKSK